jgi:hypothetical protein
VATSDTAPPIGRWAHAAWLLFGGVFTGAAVVVCAVGSWVVFNGEGRHSIVTEQQSYQHQISRIEIELDTGDVHLAGGGAAGQVSVERRLEWWGSKPIVEESWQGDTLHIRAHCDRTGLPQWGRSGCLTGYALRVPGGVAVETKVDTGAIRVNDVQGELRLSTLVGDLDIANAPGRIRASADTGTITAVGLRCAEVDAKARYGDVSLQFAVAPELVRAATVLGNVEVALPQPAGGADRYQVRVDVRERNRHVSVPDEPAAGRQLIAATSDGDVYVRYAGA